MSGFSSPNYTQVPNDLFDTHMATMSEVELRVCLAVMRQTMGFHRTRARYSFKKLCTMTGLSDEGIRLGALAAEKHGFLTRMKDEGVTVWTMKLDDDANVVGTDANNSGTDANQVGMDANAVDPHLLKKEERKKVKKEKKERAAAPLASKNPSVKAIVSRGKELMASREPIIRAYCNATGDRLAGFLEEDLTDTRKALMPLFDQARKEGISPADLIRLWQWRYGDPSQKHLNQVYDLRSTIEMYCVWVKAGRPGPAKPAKLVLRNAAGQTLDEFQEAKMLKQVDWYAQWEPIYPEET